MTTRGIGTYLRSQANEFEILSSVIERRFSRQSDIGQGLLQREDVAAHFLHSVLVHAADVLDAADHDGSHQMTHSFEDVLAI